MKNTPLNQIKKTVISALTKKYGYCRITDNGSIAVYVSGGADEKLTITIKYATKSFRKPREATPDR